MQAILAIDSGGSKTEALLVGLDGERLGYGRSQTSGRFTQEDESFGYGRTEASLRDAVRQALPDPTLYSGYHLGFCGVPGAHWDGALAPGEITRTDMTEDEPCRMMWTEPFGLVALSGTGAFVSGNNRAGIYVHLDGMGPLLGDHGSGFSLGLRAIQAAACARWHPRRATSLEAAIVEGLEGSLNIYQPRLALPLLGVRQRSRIAACAALVDREARRGDRIATEILREGARDLAETAQDVASRLELNGEDCDLIGVGGVLANSDVYWDAFVERVGERMPNLRPKRMPYAPVAGVALRVLSDLNGGAEAFVAARDRLLDDVSDDLILAKK